MWIYAICAVWSMRSRWLLVSCALITSHLRLLASWVEQLNEHSPYHCSWLIMYINDNEQSLSDECTLQQIYEKIKHKITVSNEPLLESDRNANKFERFLNNSKLNWCLAIIVLLMLICHIVSWIRISGSARLGLI